jgi:hypothetical protein
MRSKEMFVNSVLVRPSTSLHGKGQSVTRYVHQSQSATQ